MKVETFINKWSILILGIWLLCAIAAIASKDGQTMAYAFWATLLIGLGYLMLND